MWTSNFNEYMYRNTIYFIYFTYGVRFFFKYMRFSFIKYELITYYSEIVILLNFPESLAKLWKFLQTKFHV